MSVAPLTRRPARDLARMPFVGDLALQRGRVHEFCGPSRVSAAMMLARAVSDPILWISPAHGQDGLNPDGVRGFIDPGQLIFVTPERPIDLLWAMEEILRSGTVPLVFAELPSPPGLTPVRRLTLAAEAGASLTGKPPLGVILTTGDGGAAGIESRWHCVSCHKGEARSWHLERRRARLAAPQAWNICAKGADFEVMKTKINVD